MSSKFKLSKGQGIVEYVLVTALVALAATAVFSSFKKDIETAYQKVGEVLINGVTGGNNSGPQTP